jgi:methionyl-tRNA synthetase
MVPDPGKWDEIDRQMMEEVERAPTILGNLFGNFEVRKAAKAFMDICRTANKYFNDKAPWETRKNDMQTCATTIHICLQVCRVLGIVMAPILPSASRQVLRMLNIHGSVEWEDESTVLKAGTALGESEILFRKIEDEEIDKASARLYAAGQKKASGAEEEMIDIETLKKVVLKTGIVIEAEKLEGSDKLLKLQVDLGIERRQIIAGVAESYPPEDLVSRTVIIAANLKPAKIRGVESNGMVLAVASKDGYALLTTDKKVDPGVIVE